MILYNPSKDAYTLADALAGQESTERFFGHEENLPQGFQLSIQPQDGAAETLYGEIGIHGDVLNAYGNKRSFEYYQDLDKAMEECGAEFPIDYDIRDLIINPTHFPDSPVVVKRKSAERGEDKILIKTYEELLRYLIVVDESYGWVNSGFEPTDPALKKEVNNSIQYLVDVMTKWDGTTVGKDMWLKLVDDRHRANIVHLGNLTPNEAYFTKIVREKLKVEKYIEGPITGMNTSVRIVVDALGNMYYSQLHLSSYEESTLEDNWRSTDHSKEIKIETEKRLHHPKSPLFIPKRKFVSNRAQGGSVFMLSSKFTDPISLSPSSQSMNEILELHGFDPTTRALPREISELSQRIGHRMRFMYPFVGIDFVIGKDKKWYFLEANCAPNLNPLAMGKDKEYDPYDLQRQTIYNLMRNIIEA